jgi:cytidylate kinase
VGLRGRLARRRRPRRARGARRAAAAHPHRGRLGRRGRDIGTVVAPGAEVKVFLTADPAERARRRAAELGGDEQVVLREQACATSATAPRGLAADRRADAVPVDTTGLDLDEVVEQIVTLAVEAKEIQT